MEKIDFCPVCGKNNFKHILSCLDYTVSHETFNVVQCEFCGFRFTNPRPVEKEIGKYYESEEYISHSGTKTGLVNKVYSIVKKHTIKQKVKLINRLTRQTKTINKNLLDIGCGTGDFLSTCKKNGWSITGIEPSELARKQAKEKNNIEPLIPEIFFEITENRFAVITLWHVLEHIYKLDQTIEQIKNLLIEDGVLIIAVPNCNSFDRELYGTYWAAWDLPRHIYHFTEKDIKNLFSKFDFTIQTVLPMKFDSFYVSLLSEKYKTGKSNFIKGILNGLKSNINARKKKRGYSSQVYILKKNNILNIK